MNYALLTEREQSFASDIAGARSVETLLNCYCREVATPNGEVSVGLPFGQSDWPMPVRSRLGEGLIMHLRFPCLGGRLLVVVEAEALTGNFRYRSAAHYKGPGQAWQPLDWERLAVIVIDELSQRYQRPFNDELLSQIRDSVQNVATILGQRPRLRHGKVATGLTGYLESEQSLHHGHPFHPAPKSRQGFSREETRRYSPELGARFRLRYFAVRREFYVQQSLPDLTCNAVVSGNAPSDLELPNELALLPVHPWQADHLLSQPEVQAGLRRGVLVDLGCLGERYAATSSVRTVFHPDNPFFYKFSLNVRLTNCVRKNAVYELEGALRVTRIVRDLAPDLNYRFPTFRLLEEPGYQSADFGADASARREIVEGFSMILRQGVTHLLDEGVTPQLAGALFGNDDIGRARLQGLVRGFADAAGLPLDQAARRWFQDYVEQLVPPVLYSYFSHGVIFEPHLQNVLIGLRGLRPTTLVLRDFEGVKLVPEYFPAARLEGLDDEARTALWYDSDKGWNRISYCLFVNHLAEAIEQFSLALPVQATSLWSLVRDQLWKFQERYGHEDSGRRINRLLAGQPLPAKANLINRFFMRPDRKVEYVAVANPLAHRPGCQI